MFLKASDVCYREDFCLLKAQRLLEETHMIHNSHIKVMFSMPNGLYEEENDSKWEIWKDFMEKRGFELGFEGQAAKFQQIEAGRSVFRAGIFPSFQPLDWAGLIPLGRALNS